MDWFGRTGIAPETSYRFAAFAQWTGWKKAALHQKLIMLYPLEIRIYIYIYLCLTISASNLIFTLFSYLVILFYLLLQAFCLMLKLEFLWNKNNDSIV